MNGLYPKNILLKLIKFICGSTSSSLGRRVAFNDVFGKHYLG